MFDYLIRNVQILDGSGAPAYSGAAALSGGKIAAVGELPGAEAVRTVDGLGRFLTRASSTSTATPTRRCCAPASAKRSWPRASPPS